MITKIKNTESVTSLFAGWEETIIWSCLQGVMGAVYADRQEAPACAMAILGDFAFFAGKPDAALVSYKPERCSQDFIIMVPQNAGWAGLIEQCYGEKAKKVTRYAFKKEPDVFDREKLRSAAKELPPEYEMRPIGEALFYRCK